MRIDSPEKLRAFISATSEAMFRMNADWSEMGRLLGREFMADTVEPDRAWIDKYIYPEDQPSVVQEIKRAIVSKSTFEAEHRVFRVDGSLGWAHWRAIPILDAKGEITEWFGAVSDITERKHMESALRESQERYRDLFASMDEGYCIIELIFDPPGSQHAVDYRFIEVNPAFEKQSGMRNVVERRMREFVTRIEQPWLANYSRVALTGEPIRFANEYKGLHRWFDVYAFRVGRPEQHRVAVLFTDITERVLAREELKLHRDNLQKIVEERTAQLDETHKRLRITDRMAAVGTLAAGLAHDMSNLLLPLRARVDTLLANKRVDAEVHEELVVINMLMDHLRDLSRNLSLFSRDPDKEGIKGSTNLAKWCSAVCKLLNASVGREIAINWSCPEELPEVAISPHRLTQAVQNLVQNAGHAVLAAKANDPGRLPHIAVEARPTPSEDAVALKVSDNGIGMSEETLQHCIDPFFTTRDRPSAPGGGGSGLGLSLAHQIVERSGGSMELASEPGKGTAITITLPVASPQMALPAR